MNFHVGMKVVCVNGSKTSLGTFPTEGCVYTIKWIGEFIHRFGGSRGVCVHLYEIDRPPSPCAGAVVPYSVTRFRPVKTTDISIFTKMLAPTPKEREPA